MPKFYYIHHSCDKCPPEGNDSADYGLTNAVYISLYLHKHELEAEYLIRTGMNIHAKDSNFTIREIEVDLNPIKDLWDTISVLATKIISPNSIQS